MLFGRRVGGSLGWYDVAYPSRSGSSSSSSDLTYGTRMEDDMKENTRRVTLLQLVQAVQDNCGSDAEVVAVITHLVKTGRVVLGGTFARNSAAALAK